MLAQRCMANRVDSLAGAACHSRSRAAGTCWSAFPCRCQQVLQFHPLTMQTRVLELRAALQSAQSRMAWPQGASPLPAPRRLGGSIMTDAAELLAATPVVAFGSGNAASSLEHTGPVTPALVPAPLPAFPSGSSAASSGSATSGAGAPAGSASGAPIGAAAAPLHERASDAVSSAAAAPAEAAEAGAPNTVSVGGSQPSAAAVDSPAPAAVLQRQPQQQQTQRAHTPLGYIAAALRARSAAAADIAAVLHGGAHGIGSGRGGAPPSPILLAGKCVRP